MISIQNPAILLAIPAVLVLLVLIIPRNFIKFKDKEERQEYLAKHRKLRIYMALSRLLIFSLLFIALAGPYSSMQTTDPGKPKLLMLVDDSVSMALFSQDTATRLKAGLEQYLPVDVSHFAQGNSSAIGDGIINAMQGNDNLLIITDGNVNRGRSLGDVLIFASSLNTTVNSIRMEPVKSDSLVEITGPSTTTVGIQNRFNVDVYSAGVPSQYALEVEVDNQSIFSGKRTGDTMINFTQRFGEGYHIITARIILNDLYVQNNVFYKVVKVMPKAKVLYLSQGSSPIKALLEENYNIDSESQLPGKLDYAAIILDNLPASSLSADDISRLSAFILNGNGLVVFGGANSFDKGNYKGSMLETLLPGTVGYAGPGEGKGATVVLVIDISGSTGSTFSGTSYASVEDVEKALAVGMIQGLKDTDKVGVVAFNTEASVVSELSQLGPKRQELVDKITTLKYFGGTLIDQGIRKADALLGQVDGGKNMILLSDGLTGGLKGDDRDAAYAASFKGIKIYTVGVGASTDSAYLKELAAIGNGAYFEPTESQRLSVLLDGKASTNKSFGVEVYNYHHNITNNLQLNAKVSGYNYVLPKSNSQLLLSTSSGIPLLTAWWFGLGRVAAVSTDSGGQWAGDLLRQPNSLLMTRTINWAAGDPARSLKYDLKIPDSRIGQQVSATLRSVVPEKGFSKIGPDLYSSSFEPTSQGISTILGVPVAVNYPAELSRMGMSPELEKMISLTKGQVFQPSDVKQIAEKIKRDSVRTRTIQQGFGWLFTAAAIMLFLLELIVRRLGEGR